MSLIQYLRDPMEYFPEKAPERVISVVPSTTGSLIDLGLSSQVIAVSDFCPEVAGATRVGGVKSLDIETILRLKPDLVLANQEENNRKNIEAICATGIPVWLSFPQTVNEALAELWTLASLFRSEIAMERARSIEVAAEWAAMAAANQTPARYFCPIWQDTLETGEQWWMTFNSQTYTHDILRLIGGENIFAQRERKYPLSADLGKGNAEAADGRDTRYPRVGLAEIIAGQPDIILLPDEPFSYIHDDIAKIGQVFVNTPAGQAGRIFLIDGSLTNWPGTRLARALVELPQLFQI